MYGYVVPIRRRLSEQSLNQYRADYCGLCRCLGKRYGFLARFLVSYDMTFLYALLAAAREEGESRKCFCPANPFCKKQCRRQDEIMEYCADLSVLLMTGKLEDTVADGRFFKRTAARAALALLRRKQAKAVRLCPQQALSIRQQTQALAALEREHSPSLDRTAHTFAALLRDLVPPDFPNARILGQILYHTGRYLYLVDALDDLPEDMRRDNYNPLRYRYRLEGRRLSQEDQRQFLLLVEGSIDAQCAAFDLLACRSHRELLDNILRFGMPSVMQAVAQGRFHRKQNRSET